MMDRRAAEDQPYVFIGLPSAITGPYDDVVLPAVVAAARLGAGAGRGDRPPGLPGRPRAGPGPRRRATRSPTTSPTARPGLPPGHAGASAPTGCAQERPRLHPARPVARARGVRRGPGDLRVTLKLNGETMQDESTKDMIFDVAAIISCVSQTAQLLPGRPGAHRQPRRQRHATGAAAARRRRHGGHDHRAGRPAHPLRRAMTGAVIGTVTDAERRDRRGRRAVLQLGPLGRRRRARHAQLPRPRPSAARARRWSAGASASRSSQRFDDERPAEGLAAAHQPGAHHARHRHRRRARQPGLPARHRRRRRRDRPCRCSAPPSGTASATSSTTARPGTAAAPATSSPPPATWSPASRPGRRADRRARRAARRRAGSVGGRRTAGRVRHHRGAPRRHRRGAGRDRRPRRHRARPHRAARPRPARRLGRLRGRPRARAVVHHRAAGCTAREIAAIATDTWGFEVRPNEFDDAFQPLHQVVIPHMGLLIGEMWDLDALAADCAADGVLRVLAHRRPPADHRRRRRPGQPHRRQVSDVT